MEIRNVYTVTQLNSYIKNMFTQDYLLQSLWVKGEVSNCKYHSSGHIYFTLKDLKGIINCIMYASDRNGLKFTLSDGQQVSVCGRVSVYERDGKYQLYAKQIALEGVDAGQLYAKMEALKAELYELGMFSAEYKRPIPMFVKTLGVVTADTGAAVRDIIQISQRRNPYIQIILYPAIVQGDAAVESIVNGIHAMEQMGVDVMIVGRGGGSIEDLWAFNERAVAQAVFDCGIPIISAVGHETDTTIIDYVADLRAPTPSAAAELAVRDIREILGEMEEYSRKLNILMEEKVEDARNDLRNFEMRLKYLSPEAQLKDNIQYLARLEDRLQAGMQKILEEKRQKFAIYIEKLKGISPLERLNSGYSYLVGQNGKNVSSIGQVKKGEKISIYVRDGILHAEVLGKEKIGLMRRGD